MVLEYPAGLGFHRPRDVRVGPRIADAAEQRKRANHVADRTEQHYQHTTRRRRELGGDGFSGGHVETGRWRGRLQRSMITMRTGAAKSVPPGRGTRGNLIKCGTHRGFRTSLGRAEPCTQ